MRSFLGSELGSLDNFALVQTSDPTPTAGQVRIRVQATALGFVDGLILQGRYQIRPTLPYIPGGEIAGTIDACGPDVIDLSPGDRVVTWQLGGGLSDYVLVNADEVDPIPPNLDCCSAAAMLVDFQTAHYALFDRGRLAPGETVMVLGAAGGVGSAAVQLASRAGAFVIGGASTNTKRNFVREMGAHQVIDSTGDLRAQLKATAPGGVVDIVFDPVGGEVFEPMFRSLAKGGRHLVIGFAAGEISRLPINLALLKSASLVGVDIRHFLATDPDAARRVRKSLFERVASGKLVKPLVITYPLDNARDALAALTNREKVGKIVVLT